MMKKLIAQRHGSVPIGFQQEIFDNEMSQLSSTRMTTIWQFQIMPVKFMGPIFDMQFPMMKIMNDLID